MLLLAGTRARRDAARGRVETLAGVVDPAALVDLLAARRLLPLIGTRLLETVPAGLPETFAAAVARSRDNARRHGLGVETLTRRIIARLEEDGIPTLPLKGPLLAARLHGDSGLRMTNDIDLLVPAERLDDAVAVVRAEGYEAPPDPRGADGLPELHIELANPRLPSVEIHWRLHWYEAQFSRDMLDRSHPADGGLREASPPDELVALLLFYARDGFYGLRHAADLAAWWDLHGSGAEPGLADEHAHSYPLLARPLRAATAAAQRTVGVPAAKLLSESHPSAREDRAVRLAAWSGEGDTDQLRANISLVCGLLGSSASHRSLLRHDVLAPPVSLDPPSKRRARALGIRLAYAGKRIARYGLGLWATRRGREWDPLPPGA